MTGPIDPTGRALVDTNIFVYAYEIEGAVKPHSSIDRASCVEVLDAKTCEISCGSLRRVRTNVRSLDD